MTGDDYAAEREEMVATVAGIVAELGDQLGRDELGSDVLRAMLKVPRHQFVPEAVLPYAYANTPLPIGQGKTISQPFIVALMTDLLELKPRDKVLEVGTGLGYQAAILSHLAGRVYSVEIVEELAREAAQRLRSQGCGNVKLKVGDGSNGWAEEAPFDKILLAAAPEMIPPMILHQLKPGGRMVVPAGIEDNQTLILVQKDMKGRCHSSEILPVRFLPLEAAGAEDEDWEED